MSEEKRYTVLAVDDQEGILKTLDVMLRESPFRLVMASSGANAIQLAAEQPIDVVLLDILMPEVSGITVAVQMQNDPHLKGVPIVMLTAANEYATLRKAVKVGADDVLLKPIGKKPLVEKLLAAIEKRQGAPPSD